MSFVLRVEDISEALITTKARINKAIKAIDAVADDPWELTEGEDYIIAPDGSRIFSEPGAHAVIRYLQDNPPKSFIGKFLEAFKELTTRATARLRRQLVQRHLEQVGQLVVVQKDIYIQEQRLIAGYRINKAFLNRIRDEYNRNHKLQIKDGEDYLSVGNVQCYTPKAVVHIKDQILERKNYPQRRKDWIKECTSEIAVKVVAYKKQQEAFNKKVEAAKKDCRRWDKNRCQLTKTKGVDGVLLHVHHLLPVHTHKHLAYHPDNLITIRHDIHTKFHQWAAGTQAACTPVKFLDFVSLFYHDRYSEIAIRLEPLKVLAKTSPLT